MNTIDRLEIERPSWTDYFMGLAYVTARRSHDAETQHGCVITDQNHRIVGTGYNGYPRNIDDSILPNKRPAKYPWMLHSERNALANCLIRPDNGIAYVTGQCCNECIMALWQSGVQEVYMASDHHGSQLLNTETKATFDEFVRLTGITINYVKPNLTWLLEIPINTTKP
jgi:dCMP deaminase